VADAFVRLRVDGADLKRQVARDVEEGASPAGARFGKLFKASAVTALAGIGAAIGIGAVAADQAVKFQAAMIRIRTQAGATAKDVGVLSNQVLELGATRAQQGPQQLAAALYHLKSVGLDNVDAMKALRTASDLAAVGGADLESTTNALAGAWRTGIRGATNFTQAAATVNAIIGAGNMKLSDFVSAIGTGILPAAKTWGLGLAQVGGALALMTDEGQNAAEAATRLRMTFALLGAPSGAAAKQLATIGVTGHQLGEAMRSPGGLIAAITLLKTHLDASGLSATDAAALLAHAFGGGRSSATILGLINNLDVLRKKQDQINASMGRYGPAVEAQRKTAEAQFHRLEAIVQVGMIRLGDAILPVLTRVSSWLVNTGVPAVMQFWDAFVSPAASRAIATLHTAVGILATGSLAPVPRGAGQPGASASRFSPGRVVPRTAPGITAALAASPGRTAAQILPPVPAQASTWEHTLQVVHGWLVAIGGYVERTLGPVLAKAWAMALPSLRDVGTFLKDVWASTKAVWVAWAPILGPVIKAALVVIGVNLIAVAAGLRIIAWVLAHVVGPAFVVFGKLTTNMVANIRGSWDRLTSWMKTAWRVAMQVLRVVLAGLLDFILGVFASILHAAARAFGWIPGIGGQLKTAARQFDQFRTNVTNSILGIKGHTVTVGVNFSPLTAAGRAAQSGQLIHPRTGAAGGKIRGPGGPTGDRIPTMLSDTEWVIRGSSSSMYGDQAMAAVNEGRAVIAYASGGSPGLAVRTSLPSTKAINAGLLGALQKMANSNALASLGALGGGSGPAAPGVQKWAGTVLAVLRLLGLPASYLGPWLSQMQTESGGNRFAINLTDSNAAAGDPSRGLLQTIMSTFLAYAGPFVGRGIYDGFANTYAGINYATHRYGRVGQLAVIGHGHGYRAGGWVTEPVRGIGLRSGQPYSFAEDGRAEYVSSAGAVGAHGDALLAKLDRLIRAMEAAPQRTARGMAEVWDRGSRRAAYGAGYGG